MNDASAHFVVVDDATGMIKSAGIIDPEKLDELQVPAGHTRRLVDAAPVGAESRLVMWTDDEGLKARPTMDVAPNKTEVTADGVDKVSIPGVPANTEVRLMADNAVPFTHPGGDLEMAFTEAGTYVVRLTPPTPMLPAIITIEATE